MQKSKSGFTLIELLIVIVVIVILAAIGAVAYSRFQMQARDDKRRTDVAVIMSKLEQYYDEHNEYPPSCSNDEYNTATNLCPAPFSWASARTGPPINDHTSYAQLRSMFKTFPDNIRDPLGSPSGITVDTGLAFGSRVGSVEVANISYGYLYFGGYIRLPNTGTSPVITTTGVHGVSCLYIYDLGSTTTSGSFGAPFIMYYSEIDSKVYLRIANHGVPPTLNDTTMYGNMPDRCAIATK